VNSAAGTQRDLAYDLDGYLATDAHTNADSSTSTRTLAFDPMGCMRSIARVDAPLVGGEQISTSSYTCGLDGKVVARATIKVDGSQSRRIDFAGLGEIRPDDGAFVLRVPVGGSVAVEDARSLANGSRIAALSGYVANDLRGSVLAHVGFSQQTLAKEAEFDGWGKKLDEFTTMASPRHGFVGAEADEAIGSYTFGARTYDPSLRRWVSPDPLLASLPAYDAAVGDNLNLYAYVGGNPIRRIDLTGFDGEDIGERLKNLGRGFVRGAGESSVPGGMIAAALTPNLGNRDANLGRAAAHAIGGTLAVLQGVTELTSAPSMGVGGGGAGIMAAAAVGTLAVATIANGAAAVTAGAEVLVGNMSNSQPAGTAGGERAGKGFTPAGKREIDAANAAKNGGENKCDSCAQPVVPSEQSKAGVTTPPNALQRDHIIPRNPADPSAPKGDGSPSNGSVKCASCNVTKSNQMPPPSPVATVPPYPPAPSPSPPPAK